MYCSLSPLLSFQRSLLNVRVLSPEDGSLPACMALLVFGEKEIMTAFVIYCFSFYTYLKCLFISNSESEASSRPRNPSLTLKSVHFFLYVLVPVVNRFCFWENLYTQTEVVNGRVTYSPFIGRIKVKVLSKNRAMIGETDGQSHVERPTPKVNSDGHLVKRDGGIHADDKGTRQVDEDSRAPSVDNAANRASLFVPNTRMSTDLSRSSIVNTCVFESSTHRKSMVVGASFGAPQNHPPELNLVNLGKRVDAAWARLQKLQAEVAKGAELLEGESIRLNMESASRSEELQVVSSLMLSAEEKCATHQKRLTYHYRLSKALDASYQSLLGEEAVVEDEIAVLKSIAKEAQLQSSLANSAVCEAVESVSGLRVELWTLRRELDKTNDVIDALRQRQWALEDEVDTAAEALFQATDSLKRSGVGLS